MFISDGVSLELNKEPTKGGAHAKQAVSPGISNCIWPETASSDTPAQDFLTCQFLLAQTQVYIGFPFAKNKVFIGRHYREGKKKLN